MFGLLKCLIRDVHNRQHGNQEYECEWRDNVEGCGGTISDCVDRALSKSLNISKVVRKGLILISTFHLSQVSKIVGRYSDGIPQNEPLHYFAAARGGERANVVVIFARAREKAGVDKICDGNCSVCSSHSWSVQLRPGSTDLHVRIGFRKHTDYCEVISSRAVGFADLRMYEMQLQRVLFAVHGVLWTFLVVSAPVHVHLKELIRAEVVASGHGRVVHVAWVELDVVSTIIECTVDSCVPTVAEYQVNEVAICGQARRLDVDRWLSPSVARNAYARPVALVFVAEWLAGTVRRCNEDRRSKDDCYKHDDFREERGRGDEFVVRMSEPAAALAVPENLFYSCGHTHWPHICISDPIIRKQSRIFEILAGMSNEQLWNSRPFECGEGLRRAVMPRRAKSRRKSKTQGAGALSEASKKKLDAIAEETQGETLEDLLSDFDIQSK